MATSQLHSPLNDYSTVRFRCYARWRIARKPFSEENDPGDRCLDSAAVWLRIEALAQCRRVNPNLEKGVDTLFPRRALLLLCLGRDAILSRELTFRREVILFPTETGQEAPASATLATCRIGRRGWSDDWPMALGIRDEATRASKWRVLGGK